MKRLSIFLVALGVLLALGASPRRAIASTLNQVTLSDDGSQLMFDFGSSVKPSASRDGRKVLIKIKGASLKEGASLPKASGELADLRSGEHGADLWIVAVLKKAHKVTVSSDDSGFVLRLAATDAAPANAAAAPG